MRRDQWEPWWWALTGIVSLDDLLPVVAQELADLAKLPFVAGETR
jgi:hypothetical protein